MKNHTLAIIKPDAFERALVGEIVSRIQAERFQIVAARLLDPAVVRLGSAGSPAVGWSPREFYGLAHEGASYFERLVDFMESGPSLALLLYRDNAIATWRFVMGSWKQAERDPATIRGALMCWDDTLRNLVHGSDAQETFEAEYRALEGAGLLP